MLQTKSDALLLPLSLNSEIHFGITLLRVRFALLSLYPTYFPLGLKSN